jgi:hypothetical protein
MTVWYFYVHGRLVSTRLSQQAADAEQTKLIEKHGADAVRVAVETQEGA